MSKSIAFNFVIDIYTARIHILINCTEEEHNKYLKKWFPGDKYSPDEGYAARTFVYHHSEGTQEYLIAFSTRAKKDPIFVKTVSHESCHVALEICDRVGINVDTENQEAFAYLQGIIVQKILEGAWKK